MSGRNFGDFFPLLFGGNLGQFPAKKFKIYIVVPSWGQQAIEEIVEVSASWTFMLSQ